MGEEGVDDTLKVTDIVCSVARNEVDDVFGDRKTFLLALASGLRRGELLRCP